MVRIYVWPEMEMVLTNTERMLLILIFPLARVNPGFTAWPLDINKPRVYVSNYQSPEIPCSVQQQARPISSCPPRWKSIRKKQLPIIAAGHIDPPDSRDLEEGRGGAGEGEQGSARVIAVKRTDPIIVSVTSAQRISNGSPGPPVPRTQTWKLDLFYGLSRLFRDKFVKIQLIYWIRTNLKTIRTQTFVASSLRSCVWPDSSESK